LLLLVLAACQGANASDAPRAQTPLVIDTKSGPETFMVEVVASEEDQRQGLMYRKSMAPDAGMLFSFGADEPRRFWMKNTFIPLDMIFIRKTGEIVAIAPNTVPLTLTPVAPPEPASAVLEINGGTAKRLGIHVGDMAHHPAIARRPAPN
jgi:uncharacterized membrane protein (UPF0127 family)